MTQPHDEDGDDGFETEYTDEPVCPKCGAKVSDAWELSDDTEVDCTDGCGAVFSVVRHTEITYTTKIVTP